MYQRCLEIKNFLQHRSIFLLGPRQTGKSTLLDLCFPKAYTVSLLESETYRALASHPELLRQQLPFKKGLVVVDEIQRLPVLLNEVHLLVQKNKDLRFVLTGSSARKLREEGTNLLAGRAWPIKFHPLVSSELGSADTKSLLRLMNRGGLPAIYDSNVFGKDLQAYVGTYLQEEIRAEGLVRSVERFSRFIDLAAFSNGEVLNFSQIGSDVGMPPRTVIEYFKILEDTMLGTLVAPFSKTKKRKAVARSKFYLFDLGVANALLKRGPIEPNSENFGRVLEHLIFLELKTHLDYNLSNAELCYWRTHSGFEVDFVVASKLAVEVKSSGRVGVRDEKGLRALSEEFPKMRKIIVCSEKQYRKTDNGIEIYPYLEFCKLLWSGEFGIG